MVHSWVSRFAAAIILPLILPKTPCGKPNKFIKSRLIGIYVPMAMVGFCFLASALILTLLPPDQAEERAGNAASLWEEMKQGFRYVWSRKILVTLGGGFMAAGLAMGLIQPLAVFLVTERLGMEESYLQWLFAAHGAAMMIGGGIAMALSHRIGPHVLLMLGMGSLAVGILSWGGQHCFGLPYWLSLSPVFSCRRCTSALTRL